MLGILSGVSLNSGIMMVYLLLEMINEPLAMRMEAFLLTFYTGIAMLLIGVIFIVFRRRDFLL